MISPAHIAQQNSQVSQVNSTSQKPAQNTQLPVQNATPAEIKSWVAGQLLKATVLQQLSNSSMLLKVGNLKLTANTNVLLPAGSEIHLKVIKTGTQPSLQIITNNLKSTEQTNLSALRQALPKQISLTDFFANLKTINSSQQRLPPAVQQALNLINAGLASRADLTNPEAIKKALKDSGTFLESNLASSKGSNSVEGDLKGKLLRLANLLMGENHRIDNSGNKNADQKAGSHLLNLLSNNKLMPELQRHVDSALARIQLNQLNSLPEQNQQAFLLELPVKEKENVDVFSLKIKEEEDQKEDQDSQKQWSINLSFKLEGLGKLHAKLILGGQNIQASLWAEDQKTFELLQENIEELQQRLTDVEFIDPKINFYKGKPESDETEISTYKELIDIEI